MGFTEAGLTPEALIPLVQVTITSCLPYLALSLGLGLAFWVVGRVFGLLGGGFGGGGRYGAGASRRRPRAGMFERATGGRHARVGWSPIGRGLVNGVMLDESQISNLHIGRGGVLSFRRNWGHVDKRSKYQKREDKRRGREAMADVEAQMRDDMREYEARHEAETAWAYDTYRGTSSAPRALGPGYIDAEFTVRD